MNKVLQSVVKAGGASASALGLAVLLMCAAHAGELRLHKYFTDHMVLQRDKPAPVIGFAPAGATVTVTFGGQTRTAIADEGGRWSVRLDPMAASARGRTLTCRTAARKRGSAATIEDVIVGDVWLFARQTSVDVSLGRTESGKQAAAHGDTGLFRAVRIETEVVLDPQEDLSDKALSTWVAVDKKSALGLSAAAYYLGCDLARELGVPIGIVDLDMGVYFPLGWLSSKTLLDTKAMFGRSSAAYLAERVPPVIRERKRLRELKAEEGRIEKELLKKYALMVRKWWFTHPDPNGPVGMPPLEHPLLPAGGYNSVIHPLKDMAMKGVLLQLGNNYPLVPYATVDAAGNNRDHEELGMAFAQSYDTMKKGIQMDPQILPLLPKEWRRTLGDESLPIGIIMPPASDLDAMAIHAREMRELQRRISADNEACGLIMPGNDHIPFSAQPSDDRLLAERCRHWALGAVCKKEGVASSGPLLERVESEGSSATVHFRAGTAEGLWGDEESLAAFEAAGEDGVYTPARATIEGTTVKITSDTVNDIRCVRYNYRQRPCQSLVNSQGLPAIAFDNSNLWKYSPDLRPLILSTDTSKLPVEYSTPASEWEKRDIKFINGSLSPDVGGTGDAETKPLWLGPTGIMAWEFGPNLAVTNIEEESPAEGRVLVGDVIYSVNGRMLGYDQHRLLSAAITEAETEAGGGTLTLGLRRAGKNIDVKLQLAVLGSYSSTTPYHCPKTKKIVKRAEEFVAKMIDEALDEGGLTRGQGGSRNYFGKKSPVGMLDTNLLFMLAAGTPEYQGLVRRVVYALMARRDLTVPAEKEFDDVFQGTRKGVSSWNWGWGYEAMLLGEYYHATGDRNVLPHMQYLHDKLARAQVKPASTHKAPWQTSDAGHYFGGWAHHWSPAKQGPGYGLIPNNEIPIMIALTLAREAGLRVDKEAYDLGFAHLHDGRGEYARIVYGGGKVSAPSLTDPEKEAAGKLSSMNGKLGCGAALFMISGKAPTATEICARKCVYAFNNTNNGHGGMFFNNFWTPIGAHVAGEKAFKHFMKGQLWYRELYRRFDGGMFQVGRGGIGSAYAIHLVAPKKRLRILGGPRSAFAANPPEALEAAVAAHKARDYARCERLVAEVLDTVILPRAEKATGEHLLESVRILRESIAVDLEGVERFIKQGDYHRASLDLAQLRGVLPKNSPRLEAIEMVLLTDEGVALTKASLKEAKEKLGQRLQEQRQRARKKALDEGTWVCLTTEVYARGGVRGGKLPFGVAPEAEGTRWRMQIFESPQKLPEGWAQPRFDDSAWQETALPISWRSWHTACFRTKLTVADKSAIDGLRIYFFDNGTPSVRVYVNGVPVLKIDKMRGARTYALPRAALEVLRDGDNTITVSARHVWRWGSLGGWGVGGGWRYGGPRACHKGFGFRLEARDGSK